MSTAQHTTGTWEVIYDHPDAKTRPAIAYIKATDRTFESEEIALLFGCLDNPTQQANARLIAAAPDLLEALTDCRRALEIANFTQELAVVDAAISKATRSAE